MANAISERSRGLGVTAAITFALALSAHAYAAGPGQAAAPPNIVTVSTDPAYLADEIIVELTLEVSNALQQYLSGGVQNMATALRSMPPSLQALNQRWGVTSIALALPYSTSSPSALEALRTQYRRAGRPVLESPLPRLDNFYVVKLRPHSNVGAALTDYARDRYVLAVEANRIAKLLQNDPYATATYDWGLWKVNAPAVWGLTKGNAVRVAVIDTGADYNHPDLAANLLSGRDFCNNDSIAQDDDSHGTHVAGIIAAVANNSIGVAGVAPAARIIPVKAFGTPLAPGAPPCATTSMLTQSLIWALGQTVGVINNSWGGQGRSAMIDAAIKLAESMGVLTVSAAGNSNVQAYGYFPANVEYSMTVAASDIHDVKSSFSNFGVKIDVSAPGGVGSNSYATDILSTVIGAQYAPKAGTSMAAPFVSGVAALLIAQHPTWSVEQIKQAIRKGAKDVGTLGFDTISGHGRLDAAGSTALSAAPPSAAMMKPSNGELVEGAIALEGFALPSPGKNAIYILESAYGETPLATSFSAFAGGAAIVTDGPLGTLNTLDLADGPNTLRVTTFDTSGGQIAEDRNLVMVNNVYIAVPAEGQVVFGPANVQVTGKVMGNLGLQGWTLDWAAGYNNTVGPFTMINTSSAQMPAGSTLSAWNLSSVPQGDVTLRLSARFGSYTTVKYRNVIVDSDMLLGWPQSVNQYPSIKSPKIANLTGVAGASKLVYGSSVWNADGTLHSGWTANPGPGRTNPAIVNIDGGSDLELVIADFDSYFYNSSYPNGGAPVIRAYKHDKTHSKPALWAFAPLNPNGGYNNGSPSSISVGNVIGNSRTEVVFSVFFLYNNPNSETTIFVLDASTGTQLSRFNVAGNENSSLAIANIDGGSHSEIVFNTLLSNNQGGRVYVVHGDGKPAPGWPVTVSVDFEGYGTMDTVVGDLDRDCGYDIVVGKRAWKSNGTPLPGWPVGGVSRNTAAMAQIDQDGQWEVVSGGGNNVLSSILEHNGALKYLIFGNGNLLAISWMHENNSPGNPVLADLDGNGRLDIVKPGELGYANQPGRGVPLYVADALNGVVTPRTRYVPTTTPTDMHSYPIFSSAAMGDLNGDGKADLAVAAGGKIYVWSFGAPWSANAGAWPMFQRDLANTGAAPLPPWQTCPAVVQPGGPPPMN